MNQLSSSSKSSNPYLVLLVVVLGVVMSVLDTTIVNVAIAKLQVALGENTDSVQWVITAYLLALAVMLATAGWMADNLGDKRTFLLALILFTVGSLFCSLSGNLTSLILSRLVQGVGAGLLMPSGMALLTRAFPREKLGMVMALFSIPTIAFISFGPTIGGWLIDNFSWQTMFDINIPIGILGLFLGFVILKEHRVETSTRFDTPGFVTMALGLGSLLFALSNGNAGWNTDGWTSPAMLTCFGVSLAAFVLFGIFQATSAQPLIDFTLFRSANFSLSAIVMVVFGLGIFGSDFLIPLYLQTGLGLTPTQTGTVFIPFGLVMMVTGILGGRLTDRIGPKTPGLVGIALRAFGMFRFLSLTPSSSLDEILLTVCLLGAGMGFLMSPMQTAALRAIPVKKTAQAMGLIKVLQQIGGTFGVALLSTTLVNRQSFHLAAFGQAMNTADPTYQGVVTRLAYHTLAVGGGSAAGAVQQAGHIVMTRVATSAFVAAIDDVFFITMFISIVSSIPFLLLKSEPRVPQVKPQPVLD